MQNVKLTVKNYRCFSEENPVSINIDKGFTSFIGPNNSGKSSILRLIYEIRSILNYVTQQGNGGNYIENEPLCTFNLAESIGLLGVPDFDEIFCNSNSSNVVLEFSLNPYELKDSKYPVLTMLKFEFERKRPYKCSIFYKWTPRIVDNPREGQHIVTKEENLIRGGTIIANCSQIFTTIKQLANTIYIGAFRNAINKGAGKYFDIDIGTGFISTWNSWKTGSLKEKNRKIISVTNDIRRLLGFKTLEISASDNKETLQITIDGKPYLLREVGSGIAQLIVVLANAAIQEPAYILIDEPELNLHPSLQSDFLMSLAAYAKEGILYATHSLGLARAHSERVYSVRVVDNKHIVRLLENTPRYAEFIGEMGFASYKEMGFEVILLVEGVQDVKTSIQFLRKLHIDHQVVVIPLGGDALASGGREQELDELLRITKKIFALVDSERGAKGQPPKKERVRFEKVCKTLGITACLTERRAIENYLSGKAIKAEKGPKYNALAPYEKRGSNPLSWGKPENWRIAARMDWTEIESTDVGKFFLTLKKKLLP
ncbi:MAG: AAA family ATPase [Candidatus Zapsychrus exili]|nr:AAA family ATPase [Candidatus Zapsychrus exili]